MAQGKAKQRSKLGKKEGAKKPQCKATTKSGNQCQKQALDGDDFCMVHSKDPARVKARAEHQSKNGKITAHQRRVQNICTTYGNDECKILDFDEHLQMLSSVFMALISMQLGPIDIQSIATISAQINNTRKVQHEINKGDEDKETEPISVIMRVATPEELIKARDAYRANPITDPIRSS